MSAPLPEDPRLPQAGATDESLLRAHEGRRGGGADGGHYRALPLILLFLFSGVVFYAATYLNQYAGHYHPAVFNENGSPPNAQAGAPKLDPLVLGRKQFEQVCSTCHQATGLGVEGIYPPLAGSEWVTGDPEHLIRIVVHGLKGPVTVKGKSYGVAAMPAFGQVAGSGYNWTDDRIAAVLSYARQAWGNTAGPITPEQIAAVRTKAGNRKEWSAEELGKPQ